jgi:hypothetical protein
MVMPASLPTPFIAEGLVGAAHEDVRVDDKLGVWCLLQHLSQK